MNIVIVAGGNGTRFKTLSVFPKILLPLPSGRFDSIISSDIDLFKDNELYLIINKKYYEMTINYLKVNHLDSYIKVYLTDNTNGSYNSILDCIEKYEDFPKSNVLFVWSDLILSKEILNFDQSQNIIFTFKDGKYRYNFDGNEIKQVETYDGNVPGVYYIKDINQIFNIELNKEDNFDLIDAINKSKQKFEKVEIQSLIELKNYEVYKFFIAIFAATNAIYNFWESEQPAQLKTRFFNKISITDDKLTKKAIDEKYYNIIEREFGWYKYGYENVEGFEDVVPRIDLDSFKDNSFTMEYLKDYTPLHEYLESWDSYPSQPNDDKVSQIYQNLKNSLDKLHKPKLVSKETFREDLKKEVIDKVIDRCEAIRSMLINYDYKTTFELLTKAYNYLENLEQGNEVEYVFMHGDLNGSNVMLNQKTLDIKFIDPRGYFGNTMLYGWKPYEYAKLLYCLNGYDDFNNRQKIYGEHEPKRLRWYDSIDYLNKKEYKILVGVIFVALAGYISQNIMKANITYEYGMKILKEELDV